MGMVVAREDVKDYTILCQYEFLLTAILLIGFPALHFARKNVLN